MIAKTETKPLSVVEPVSTSSLPDKSGGGLDLDAKLVELNLLVQKLGPGLSIASSSGLKNKLRLYLLRALLGTNLCESFANLPDILRLNTQVLNEQQRRLGNKHLEVQELIKREVENFRMDLLAEVGSSNHNQQLLNQKLDGFEQNLKQLDSVCRGLEAIVARSANRAVSNNENENPDAQEEIDYSYLMLENRFRGSQAVVKERLRDYVSIFSDVKQPVLEIGAGRGELQELFNENGIKSYGLELDAAMVEECKLKNLDVKLDNGVTHLASLGDSSLGGVIAIQVVEHLPLEILKELLELCSKKVIPGGRIVFETINTSSLLALSHNYFRDPTHAHPLHPDTMKYLAQLCGLEVVDVLLRSAYPSEATLQEISAEAFYPQKWNALIEQFNTTIRSLNTVIFGHQDYALVATPSK